MLNLTGVVFGACGRLSPYNMADGSLGYRSLGTREPVPTSLETTMSSAVCCMQVRSRHP